MKPVTKMILSILLVLGCFAYTFYNYTIGQVNQQFLLITIALLAIPLFNISRALIKELLHKE